MRKRQKGEETKLQKNMAAAEDWIERRVTIFGVGGRIYLDGPCTHNQVVKTGYRGRSNPTTFFVERVMVDHHGGGGGGGGHEDNSIPANAIAFRVVLDNTDDDGDDNMNGGNAKYYLTNVMYGDEIRRSISDGLASIPQLPIELIPDMVDYAAGRSTTSDNFEGAGFCYNPMTIQKSTTGIPHKLQWFTLEQVDPGRGRVNTNSFGVRSLFGTYWRSQHWDHVISQSPHLLGDETWYFSKVQPSDDSDSDSDSEGLGFGEDIGG